MSLKEDIAENWKEFENIWGYYVIVMNLQAKLKDTNGRELIVAM